MPRQRVQPQQMQRERMQRERMRPERMRCSRSGLLVVFLSTSRDVRIFSATRYAPLLPQIKLWNYALTDDEIHDNRHKVCSGTERGIVGYW